MALAPQGVGLQGSCGVGGASTDERTKLVAIPEFRVGCSLLLCGGSGLQTTNGSPV